MNENLSSIALTQNGEPPAPFNPSVGAAASMEDLKLGIKPGKSPQWAEENLSAQRDFKHTVTEALRMSSEASPGQEDSRNVPFTPELSRLGGRLLAFGTGMQEFIINSSSLSLGKSIGQGFASAATRSSEGFGSLESLPQELGMSNVPLDIDGPDPGPLGNDHDLDDLPILGNDLSTWDGSEHHVHANEDLLGMLSGFFSHLFEEQRIRDKEEEDHASTFSRIKLQIRRRADEARHRLRASNLSLGFSILGLGLLALGAIALSLPDMRLEGFGMSLCGIGLSGFVLVKIFSRQKR